MNKNISANLILAAVLLGSLVALYSSSQAARAASTTSRKPKELANGQNCTNHLQIIDKCSSMATYSYTTSFNQYPINASELKVSCQRFPDALKCLKTHGKCMSNIARRSLTAFSNSRSRHSKRICGNLNDQKATDFWKSNACIKDTKKRPQMIASERELISTIEHVATNTSMKWDDRFHTACCAANSYKAKLIKDLEPECLKYKEAQEDMMNSMIGELLETACPESNRLNELCLKLPKLTLAKEWKPTSLTGASLDLIVALSDNPKK